MATNVPWAIFSIDDVFWVGLAESESTAWTIALGWPSPDEIEDCKARGMYASRVDLVKRKS